MAVKNWGYSIAISSLLFLMGCSSIEKMMPPEKYIEPPKLAEPSKMYSILRNLPGPKHRIIVSVYDFRDQTGQNKSGQTVQYSRAVTQGGLSILKKSLLDAGEQSWFRVLERGGLDHLLQERKIIRAIRSEYTTKAGTKLPALGPLLYSGVLLEGGIISYESNIFSGGLGARYLGIGGSTEYRRDVVTVYLRAISVTSGEILAAVNTSKTIFSTKIAGGFFKFVSFDKLIEAETGFAANEPPQFAVRQAIEMAVYALIMKGYEKKLWTFEDRARGQRAYQKYLTYVNGTTEDRKNSTNPSCSYRHRSYRRVFCIN